MSQYGNNQYGYNQYNNLYGRNANIPYVNSYTYVNGLEGARAYQMMPNQMILLMDSDKPYFYTKTSNAMGQSTIRVYEFKEVPQQEEIKVEYATKQDLEEIKQLILGNKKDGQ